MRQYEPESEEKVERDTVLAMKDEELVDITEVTGDDPEAERQW